MGLVKMSRRDLFKFTGVAAAAAVLTGCSSPDAKKFSDVQLLDLESSPDSSAFTKAVLRQSLPSSNSTKWNKDEPQKQKVLAEWVNSKPFFIDINNLVAMH